jgi:DNA-binding transcriptional MerR regulator
MKKVSEVSKLAGISVRTLHYYDELGLLVPKTMENGYRLYDEECLKTLQQILFFRELGFTLKEIKNILSNPTFDRDKALRNHKHLLQLKRKRLDELISLVDESLKGDCNMSFKEFDMTEIEKYKTEYEEEVKERWGHSSAYKQSAKKIAKYKKDDWQRIMSESSEIFEKIAEFKDLDVSDPLDRSR